MGLIRYRNHVALAPKEFPHSSPEAPRTTQARETSTSELYKNLASTYVIHGSTRFFYMPQSWDMGQSSFTFTSPPKEGMLRIFFMYRKNPTTSSGFEPADSGTRGQHANRQTTEQNKAGDCILIPLRTKLYLSDLNTQSVPRSKHSACVIRAGMLMLYREIIAVYTKIHTKHINALCGQNTEFLNVKAGGTYSNHWALNG
jgi:hypothetical protein